MSKGIENDYEYCVPVTVKLFAYMVSSEDITVLRKLEELSLLCLIKLYDVSMHWPGNLERC